MSQVIYAVARSHKVMLMSEGHHQQKTTKPFTWPKTNLITTLCIHSANPYNTDIYNPFSAESNFDMRTLGLHMLISSPLAGFLGANQSDFCSALGVQRLAATSHYMHQSLTHLDTSN